MALPGVRHDFQLDGSSLWKPQASERDDQERDEKGCDHKAMVVVGRRRETVEWLAIYSECRASTYQYENGEERPNGSENRADERRSGEAEGEQGDRDCAAETVDPDRLATGAARRDNHGGRSQYDCDPENEACSPFPRLPDHLGIAEAVRMPIQARPNIQPPKK